MKNDEAAAGSASDVSSTSDGKKEKKKRGEHCFVHCLCTTEDFCQEHGEISSGLVIVDNLLECVITVSCAGGRSGKVSALSTEWSPNITCGYSLAARHPLVMPRTHEGHEWRFYCNFLPRRWQSLLIQQSLRWTNFGGQILRLQVDDALCLLS